MRGVVVVTGIVLMSLFVPPASATATPLPLWPSAGFLDRTAAANLTAWTASRLNLSAVGAGEWLAVNRTSIGPDFAAAVDAYRLPVVEGSVEASYTANGSLARIVVAANTSYVSGPFVSGPLDWNLSALEALAARVASDLGLNASLQAGEYAIPGPAIPLEERVWTLGIGSTAPLGYPANFNTMHISVREWDRRLVRVDLMPWFIVSGTPDVTRDQASAIAVRFARERFAENATAETGSVYAMNAGRFVYEVYATWPAANASTPDCPHAWALYVWVDATSGAVVEWQGPMISEGCPDTGGRPLGPLLGILVPAAILALAALLAFALFLRISGRRALDHFTRGQIVGYVSANPGSTYSQVRKSLGLSNGTLAYHLWVLERLGFVRSERQGRLRRLFPTGPIARSDWFVLSPIQYAILDVLHAQGPMSQIEIARRLRVSKQRAHYNVNALRKLALLQNTGEGRIGLSTAGAETVLHVRHTPSGAVPAED